MPNHTPQNAFRLAWATAPTGTAGTEPVCTTTAPTGSTDGRVRVSGNPETAELLFTAPGGTANGTVMAHLYTWHELVGKAAAASMYAPVERGRYKLTFGTAVGLASQPVAETALFADTIVGDGGGTVGAVIVSNASNRPAVLRVPIEGALAVEVNFTAGDASTPNANAAIRTF